jgi:hypothetical protein
MMAAVAEDRMPLVQARMPKGTIRRAESLAQKLGITKSEIIRLAVGRLLDQQDED